MKSLSLLKRLLCVIVALMMLLTGCSTPEPATDTSTGDAPDSAATEDAGTADGEEKVVTMGVTSAWLSLSHAMWQSKDAQQVFTAPLFDTLAIVNGEGVLEPAIYSSWEATDDTYSEYICKIDPNAYWHDGEKVTADDVVFTYKFLLNPEVEDEFGDPYIVGTDESGQWVNSADDLGIEAVDEETVKMTLKQGVAPDTYFYALRYSYIFPEHLLADVAPADLATIDFWENPVGSGPFMFDSYIDGERMEYVVNENYYKGAADIDRLIIKVVASSALLSSLMSGDVDVTAYSSALSANDLDMAAEAEGLSVTVAEGYSHDHLLINNQKFDTDTRLALNYLVDKDLLAEAAYGKYAEAADSLFNISHPYYSDVAAEMAIGYDQAAGITMLEDAGFDFSKTYTIHVQSDQAQRVSAATVLQQIWSEAGINCEVVQADMATISAALFAGECDFAVMGSAASNSDPTTATFYYIENGWNQMTDMTINDLWDEVKVALTYEDAYALTEQFQVLQAETSPMIYLYFKTQTYVVSDRLSNVDTSGFGVKNWKYYEWTVE